MARLGLESHIVDAGVRARAIEHFRRSRVALPTFSQLARPETIPATISHQLNEVDPDAAHPLNLFRVHWFNSPDRRGRVEVPAHLVLPSSLTGVRAPIVVALGWLFPMIRAHKVLAAYACLAPRLVTGQFDPSEHRALWPSTGNYCRGGVAISKILDCHGVAILPAGMSAERFDWLARWVKADDDIVRTPGTESNVKEIYDKCAELEADPHNIIFNQFCEFANYLVHHHCTGRALETIFTHLPGQLSLEAFVSATGSAGTIGAGDYLKDRFGTRIVAAEALECPTLLENGFGEHNIQGIGDKHVPFIHNVMNTDLVVAISEHTTDCLDLLFNSPTGRNYLKTRRGVDPTLVDRLGQLGLSSLCNIASAIKVARYFDFDETQAIITVATDAHEMYATEYDKALAGYFPDGFDPVAAGEVYGQHLAGLGVDHLLELTHPQRKRIFNLGYYTWVEQQGVALADFEARRKQAFWRGLHELVEAWDEQIQAFNAETGALA
ncbi:MAG: pyridoxal-5'-phosphate-dependent protein subunit beta [Vulcanimicrobiota bacterium]